jgi:hypothetical protein
MLKPIVFTNVTNKYINEKLNELNITEESKEFLKEKLFESMKKRKLFLKDLNAIHFSVRRFSTGRIIWEIAVYTKDSYYTVSKGD